MNIKKRLLTVLALLVAAGVIWFCFGRYETVMDISSLAPQDEEIMLIDLCEKTVATVGGDGYSERVLYLMPDGSYELRYYSKYEGDSAESCRTAASDAACVKAAYRLIDENHVTSWTEDGVGLCGKVIVLKFRTQSGEYIRVSTDTAPADAANIMEAIGRAMEGIAQEETTQRIGQQH